MHADQSTPSLLGPLVSRTALNTFPLGLGATNTHEFALLLWASPLKDAEARGDADA